MTGNIEILPHPTNSNGFLIALSFPSQKGSKTKAEEIKDKVVSFFLLKGCLLQNTSVQWSDGAHYFEIIPKEIRPELLHLLEDYLRGIFEGNVKNTL